MDAGGFMSDTELYRELCDIAGDKRVLKNEPMSLHTSFRTGGPADIFVVPKEAELPEMIGLCVRRGVSYTVIGNGSNLLVGDGGIRGVVFEIGKPMAQIAVEGTKVRAGAGALLSAVAAKALDASLTGFEFASGIPGSIGGAAVMNAGAYGGEMKDVLFSVRVLDEKGCAQEIQAKDLALSYRHSVIPEKNWYVLEALLQFKTGEKEAIRGRMNELKEQRIAKQPVEYPSAGSTFKRPEGYFAGKLIQDAGLKGYTVGGAQVSKKHSGFVINCGGATSADVRQLIADVQRMVYEDSGVHMEPEVKFLGEF